MVNASNNVNVVLPLILMPHHLLNIKMDSPTQEIEVKLNEAFKRFVTYFILLVTKWQSSGLVVMPCLCGFLRYFGFFPGWMNSFKVNEKLKLNEMFELLKAVTPTPLSGL